MIIICNWLSIVTKISYKDRFLLFCHSSLNLIPMALQTASELQPYILRDVKRTGKKLGCGSFGCVEELIHAGAHCAGKIIHETLIDSKKIGVQSVIKKFEIECRILSRLRHPSIVQFLGIAIFGDSQVPVLVMESLEASLDSLLDQGKILSMSIKTSVLLDIAKGLVYLHSHSPPVIHRDLTARNVLLTSTIQAKIADLGNARITESQTLKRTLSSAPGTLVYMPPEAMAHPPQYDEKLDMFSFGHLALYVAIQEFPCELLAGVYTDPTNPNRACARNEIERRSRYIGSLRTSYGTTHTITRAVLACLHNHSQSRPSAVQILHDLQKLQVEQKATFQKFQLDEYVSHQDDEKFSDSTKVQSLLRRIMVSHYGCVLQLLNLPETSTI